MQVDLVQVTTRDGIRLDGSLQMPSVKGGPTIAVDAFCFLHGTGGNFYSSTLFDTFSEHFQTLGSAILRVNTRGHDGISTAVTAKGGRRLGAAYEVVDECRHDVAAWLEYLRQRVGPRVVLVGHSLGAVKCLYALAQEPQSVAGIVALSPPRLSYSWFCTQPQGPEFLETYRQAEALVSAGQSAGLLDVKLPLPFIITAAGYVEKYGPDERYNYLRFIGSVRCPVLVALGSVEMDSNMAFRGAPEALAEPAARHGRLSVATIDGADHFYTGVRSAVIARVEAWLRATLT